MRWRLEDKALDSAFLRNVERMSGENISACYQCGKCSGGCPVTPDVEVTPNQVLRMAQLGLEDEALNSDMVWNCAGCGTCTSRCPEGIQVTRVLDSLRAMALHKGATKARGATPVLTFYRAFLESVRTFGRNSEVGLMGAYNISSGRLWTNLTKAPWFMLKTKIAFTVNSIKQLDRLERVFERIEAIEEEEWREQEKTV